MNSSEPGNRWHCCLSAGARRGEPSAWGHMLSASCPLPLFGCLPRALITFLKIQFKSCHNDPNKALEEPAVAQGEGGAQAGGAPSPKCWGPWVWIFRGARGSWGPQEAFKEALSGVVQEDGCARHWAGGHIESGSAPLHPVWRDVMQKRAPGHRSNKAKLVRNPGAQRCVLSGFSIEGWGVCQLSCKVEPSGGGLLSPSALCSFSARCLGEVQASRLG